MGRRGRRPTPTALVLARGNPGKRTVNHDEPALERSVAHPPKGLSGRAKKEWQRLAPELLRKGVLTVGDVVIFETYCRLVGDVEAYEKLVKRVSHETAHRLGYAGHLLKLRAQLKQFAAELGLTPSSRRGIAAVKPPEAQDDRRRRFFGLTSGQSQKGA